MSCMFRPPSRQSGSIVKNCEVAAEIKQSGSVRVQVREVRAHGERHAINGKEAEEVACRLPKVRKTRFQHP